MHIYAKNVKPHSEYVHFVGEYGVLMLIDVLIVGVSFVISKPLAVPMPLKYPR